MVPVIVVVVGCWLLILFNFGSGLTHKLKKAFQFFNKSMNKCKYQQQKKCEVIFILFICGGFF